MFVHANKKKYNILISQPWMFYNRAPRWAPKCNRRRFDLSIFLCIKYLSFINSVFYLLKSAIMLTQPLKLQVFLHCNDEFLFIVCPNQQYCKYVCLLFEHTFTYKYTDKSILDIDLNIPKLTTNWNTCNRTIILNQA